MLSFVNNHKKKQARQLTRKQLVVSLPVNKRLLRYSVTSYMSHIVELMQGISSTTDDGPNHIPAHFNEN